MSNYLRCRVSKFLWDEYRNWKTRFEGAVTGIQTCYKGVNFGACLRDLTEEDFAGLSSILAA